MSHFLVVQSILLVLLLSDYIVPLEKDQPSTILYPENFLLKGPCVLVCLRSFCEESVLIFFIYCSMRLASFHSLAYLCFPVAAIFMFGFLLFM